MTTWEYTTDVYNAGGNITDNDQNAIREKLNFRGGQGWELAGTESINDANGSTRLVMLIFKRLQAD